MKNDFKNEANNSIQYWKYCVEEVRYRLKQNKEAEVLGNK